MPQAIRSFELINNGGFDCAGEVKYIDNYGNESKTNRWHWITNPNSETMIPSENGVGAGWLTRIYIDIKLGNDRTGRQWFTYDPSSKACAVYRITGTTFDSQVHFEGVVTNS